MYLYLAYKSQVKFTWAHSLILQHFWYWNTLLSNVSFQFESLPLTISICCSPLVVSLFLTMLDGLSARISACFWFFSCVTFMRFNDNKFPTMLSICLDIFFTGDLLASVTNLKSSLWWWTWVSKFLVADGTVQEEGLALVWSIDYGMEIKACKVAFCIIHRRCS